MNVEWNNLTLQEAIKLAKKEEALGWRYASVEVQNWRELA